MWSPQDNHSGSHHSFRNGVHVLVLHTAQCALRMLFGLNPMCVCPLVFLYECLTYRGGWSGLENILCDSTSGLASLSSDIPHSLLCMQHFDCSFIVLCRSPRLEGDAVTIQELCEFRGLSVGEMGGKVLVWGKKEWKQKYRKKVLMSLYFILLQLELEGWTKWPQNITFTLWWNYCWEVAMIS